MVKVSTFFWRRFSHWERAWSILSNGATYPCSPLRIKRLEIDCDCFRDSENQIFLVPRANHVSQLPEYFRLSSSIYCARFHLSLVARWCLLPLEIEHTQPRRCCRVCGSLREPYVRVVIGIYYTWIERTVEEQRLQREMEQSSFTESFGRRIRTFGFCPDHRRTIFSVFYVAAFSDHVRKFTLLRPEKKKKKNETANRRGRGTTLPLSDLLLISCYCATCLSFVRLARPESFTTKDEREREREERKSYLLDFLWETLS